MATTKAISGNTTKNNGGTILHCGNIDGVNVTNDLSLRENAFVKESKVFQAVSPNSSGNLGTLKAYSAGNFGRMEEGYYVGKIIGSRIAGVANTFLRSGASETSGRRPFNPSRGNHRYNITSWNYTTGAATKGAGAGVSFAHVEPAGAGASGTVEAFPTDAVPGELVYMTTGKIPTQDNYKARTSP